MFSDSVESVIVTKNLCKNLQEYAYQMAIVHKKLSLRSIDMK